MIDLTPDEWTPERRRDFIRDGVDRIAPVVIAAWRARDWQHFGYEDWQAYSRAEFVALRLEPGDRQAIVGEMRAEGMSTRAIAGALGVNDRTVRRDLPTAANAAVDRVVGLDGKSRPARRPPAVVADAIVDGIRDTDPEMQDLAAECAEDQVTAWMDEQAPPEPERRPPPRKEHPATFSVDIITVAAAHLREAWGDRVADIVVLDPFAGLGGVHRLRDEAGVRHTIGVEIEPEWAGKHPDTICGDSRRLDELIAHPVDAIVTSPTYGNRMADHHDARDDSVRLTYKHSLGRDLTPGNTGALQWTGPQGDEYRRIHTAIYAKAVRLLSPGGTFTLNVKNHVRGGGRQRVVEWHEQALLDLGLVVMARDAVLTGGLMAGANADVREPVEWVTTFRRDRPTTTPTTKEQPQP